MITAATVPLHHRHRRKTIPLRFTILTPRHSSPRRSNAKTLSFVNTTPPLYINVLMWHTDFDWLYNTDWLTDWLIIITTDDLYELHLTYFHLTTLLNNSKYIIHTLTDLHWLTLTYTESQWHLDLHLTSQKRLNILQLPKWLTDWLTDWLTPEIKKKISGDLKRTKYLDCKIKIKTNNVQTVNNV